MLYNCVEEENNDLAPPDRDREKRIGSSASHACCYLRLAAFGRDTKTSLGFIKLARAKRLLAL